MHIAKVITTGSANQWPNIPCIWLLIDVTFRGLELSYGTKIIIYCMCTYFSGISAGSSELIHEYACMIVNKVL